MEQRQAAVLLAQQRFLDEEETWNRKLSDLEASAAVCTVLDCPPSVSLAGDSLCERMCA
eukprot:m.1477730 g.1477730  ORF g.1477730 m.1477730 type:complete len:59 (+) comp25162_c0_seq31:2238-2414(+)